LVEVNRITNTRGALSVNLTTTNHSLLTGRDTADSHPASAITNTPAGNISAITVQAAIDELDAEKQPLDGDLTAIAALAGTSGLLRKTARLGPLEGLTLETLLIAPVVLPWLAWISFDGSGALATASPQLMFWLVMAGPLTAVPLMMFAAAARRLKLATVGLFQYLSPSLQLGIGVVVFGEPFDAQRLAGFVLIWTGLAVYTAHSLALSRRAGVG
jgi:drug/metabolite transporter (DMT)-like permease